MARKTTTRIFISRQKTKYSLIQIHYYVECQFFESDVIHSKLSDLTSKPNSVVKFTQRNAKEMSNYLLNILSIFTFPLTSGSDRPYPLCLFSGSPAGNAMGGLSIAAGILLIINLLTLGVTLRSH